MQVGIAGDWWGYSLFFPSRAAALEGYPDYTLFKGSRLLELMRRLGH